MSKCLNLATMAWFNVMVIHALDCFTSRSCSNQVLSLSSDDYCFCHGYQSCIGSYMDSSGADCWGVGACFSSPYFFGDSWGIWCGGYASCVNIPQITVPSSLCFSKFGCAISEIGWPECYGEYSCAWSEIKGNEYGWSTFIPVYGTLALYQTHIYSNGYGVDIRMYGYYSGYNSTLHCESGDSCSVTCYGNACFNFEIDCANDASCSVNCVNSVDTVCPNGYGGSSDYELMDDIILNLDLLYNYDLSTLLQLDPDINKDDIVNYINDTMVKRKEECDSSVGGVFGGTLEEYTDTNLSSSNNGSICCSGADSCQRSNINVNVAVGEEEGYGNLYCDGYYGCANTINVTIMGGKGGSIYASSRAGIAGSTKIDFRTRASGVGDESRILTCSGDISCYGATVYGVDALIITGSEGGRDIVAYNVSNVYGLSHFALVDAKIYNIPNKDINVYIMGYLAGSRTNVTCVGGNETVCTIYCNADACTDETNCTSIGGAKCVKLELSNTITPFFFCFLLHVLYSCAQGS